MITVKSEYNYDINNRQNKALSTCKNILREIGTELISNSNIIFILTDICHS